MSLSATMTDSLQRFNGMEIFDLSSVIITKAVSVDTMDKGPSQGVYPNPFCLELEGISAFRRP